MQDEVRAGRLADVTVSMRPLDAHARAARGARGAPERRRGRAAVERRRRACSSASGARPRVVDRRAATSRASTSTSCASTPGALPAPGEVLTDVQNANVGALRRRAGDTVTVVAPPAGSARRLPRQRRGRNLPTAARTSRTSDVIVLYATADTVAALERRARATTASPSGCATRAPPPPRRRSSAVRALPRDGARVPGLLRTCRRSGRRATGPGRRRPSSSRELLERDHACWRCSRRSCSISNTMTTLVAEQTGEIGIMRAIGARRRQIALVYLRTALLLGALGAVVGVGARDRARERCSPATSARRSGRSTSASASTRRCCSRASSSACSAPPLAALPAIRRGVAHRPARGARVDRLGGRRTGRRATGSCAAPLPAAHDADRAARASGGASGAASRRRVIVALAVGNLLAVARRWRRAATETTHAPTWDDHLEDRRASGRAAASSFDASARGRRSARRPASPRRSRRSISDVELAGEDAVRVGRAARAALPLPALGRPLVQRRRGAGARARRGDRAQPRRSRRRRGRRPRHAHDGRRARLRSASSASPRTSRRTGPCCYVPLTTLRSRARPADRGEHLLDQRPTSADHAPDRPDDDAARGPARARSATTSASEITYVDGARRDRGRTGTHHDLDRRARVRDRRDQHGRARQRDHDERARAHARDRHPPLHRRAGARRPAHLRRPKASRSPSPAGCSASRSATCSTACSSGWSGRSSTSRSRSCSRPGTS